MFNDVFFSPGHEGYGYHLPSYWEWVGIFSGYRKVSFNGANNNILAHEGIECAGIRTAYNANYYSISNTVCYALRYQKCTQGPQDSYTSQSFPWAPDNSMACAFRYEIMGIFGNNSLTSQLKVQCVYVGDQDPLPNLQTVIAQESWWNSQPAGKVITRIFPASGLVAGGSSIYYPSTNLNARGWGGAYWSSTGNQYNDALTGEFTRQFASSVKNQERRYGLTIRLFSNE